MNAGDELDFLISKSLKLELKPFSSKIECAWKVVEKVIELPQFNDRHCYFNIKQHRAEFKEAEVEMRLFELRDGEELLCGPYYVLGESAPHAISLAALKAVGYVFEEKE